ncbi:hypothetical protein LIER_02723 [Lithospermum erythrorhizon]|uniref:Nucleolar pre-ribosomal-associated protein 1 n=1 Tax=Lithospermum erythrorhizon TaxID=34254 RepID=A0AAV3NS05_LITER
MENTIEIFYNVQPQQHHVQQLKHQVPLLITPDFSNIAKLKELLKNINSTELQLCLDACKQFIKLIKAESGTIILTEYLNQSSKCIEILQAWDVRKSKPGFSGIIKLVSVMLSCFVGEKGGVFSGILDDFARLVVEERMEDLNVELGSKEGRRQKAVLGLLGAIVRRRLGLGWEVMKIFDFKSGVFVKLADWKGRRVEGKRKHLSTRKAFVEFAMSFLEVANPRLLREILQQRGMYSGVLRGLGDDDDEVAVHVLSTLRDKVLVPESLVPPGLRSVLFGIVTLEQLVSISGREDGGMAAEIAHEVLIMVCTDPANGLMPDLDRQPSPLRGNPKRLFDLMKKLKAAEFEHHKELLLALVKGRPLFGSSYLNEFPYYIDDLTRSNWFASVSLAAKVISAVADGLTFGFLNSSTREPPDINSPDVQSIIKCIGPRALTRDIIYKGLRHADPLVKHATLKLVLEALKLLASLFGALKDVPCSSDGINNRWEILMRDIENELRMSLPFPGELFSLLSPLYKNPKSCQKRPATEAALEHNPKDRKKLKMAGVNEDVDIVIGGISSANDMILPGDSGQNPGDHDMDQEDDDDASLIKLISEIWEVNGDSLQTIVHSDEDTFFYSKVLDALKVYQHAMVNANDGTFDYFKLVPDNILCLPDILQRSLLSLLVEHVGWSSHGKSASRAPAEIYKHLRKFIKLLLFSSSSDVKYYAYILAKEAMLSTGAFDRNSREISAWLLLIPGYGREYIADDQGIASIEELSSIIISFLCDAVSIIAKNLFGYLKDLRHYMDVKGARGQSPRFGPFFICVLHQCSELLSRSGKKTLPKKTIISVYVCSTLKYFLETQAEAQLLSSLIDYDLSEIHKFDISGESGDLCEWRPMKILLLFSRNIAHQFDFALSSNVQKEWCSGDSLAKILDEVKGTLQSKHDDLVGVTIGLSYSILCSDPQELCQSFPLLMTISAKLLGVPLSLLSSIFFLEPNLLLSVSRLWPKLFVPGLEVFDTAIKGEETDKDLVGFLDVDSMQAASFAFSFFLKGAPFHVLFPISLLVDGSLTIVNLLIHKIPFTLPDEFTSSLSRVLFFLNQAIVTYRSKPYQRVEIFCESCINLIEQMLNKVFVDKLDSDSSSDASVLCTSQYVVEIGDLVLGHPAVLRTLELLIPGEDLKDAILGESLELFPEIAKQGVQKIDLLVLNLVRTTCELISSFFDRQMPILVVNHDVQRIVKVFNSLKTRLFVILKDRFNQCVKSGDFAPLIPIFVAVHLLISFISPFELLETVHSLISEIDLTTETLSPYYSLSAILHVAACAFDMVLAYLREPSLEKQRYHLFWGMEERTINIPIFENVFFWICEIASRFELDLADSCLQKALMVAKAHQSLENYVTQVMHVSRVVACTPINMLFHCMKKVTKIKSLLLLSLAGLSSLHLSVFGFLFGSMIDKSSLIGADLTGKESGHHLSDEELVLLLPTALLYINCSVTRYEGLHSENKECIPSLYWRMLTKGFLDWKTYASRSIFEIGPGEPWPTSLEQFLNIVSTSLLGKSAHMLRHYLDLSGDPAKMEIRMSLFESLHLQTDHDDSLLENSSLSDKSSQFGDFSLVQCLNIANRVVAKIYLSLVLLFPERSNSKSLHPEELYGLAKDCYDALDSLRTQFLNKLVHLWELVVKSFPSTAHDPEHIENKRCSLFRYLEQFIRGNILDLMQLMNDCLIRQPCPRFVKKVAKISISQRFEDADTLKMLQSVLSLVYQEKFSCVSVLRKLLDHSQSCLAFLSANNSMASSFGMIFTPMHSIIRSISIPYAPLPFPARENKLSESDYMKLLEVVKLLRVILRVSAQEYKINSVGGTEINLRELVSFLLSLYGATMGKLDVEIFSVINEIELIDQQSSDFLVEMDYLWGRAAFNPRKEGQQVIVGSYGGLSHTEASKEQRKIQFRENFPVDPKMCAATVVNFPYNRTISDVSPDMFHKESFEDVVKGNEAENVRMHIYDPVFILRFSVHCLSMGYVEPQEFANSGLLAISIVSLSSPNDDLRKLGYRAIGKFKSEVERSPKGSAIKRLKVLLLYLQNGIEQPGQRIPSPTAVFLAESTLVLLNSLHVHHATVIKFLMLHPKANMLTVPLFESFFSDSESSSADRAWMLYLLHAGLNTDEDAQIYMRNSIIEILLSFYLSPVCDDKSKELILQILKKSVILPKVALSLVKDCGLIPWLSSIISSEARGGLSLTQIDVVLEVLYEIISARNTFKWLQKSAIEQISELATRLFELLVDRTEMIKEHSVLVRRCILVLLSAVRISQKYKVCKPHLTLSAESLVRLCEAVDACSHERSDTTAELGLKVLLMSTPPTDILHMAPEKLLKLVSWAISISLKTKSKKVAPAEFYCQVPVSSEGDSDDSLAIKLLRWLTASAILTKLSRRSHNLNLNSLLDKSKSNNLQSFLEWHHSGGPAENLIEYGNQELLAASLICLQQLLDVNSQLLSSIIFALCLLLIKDSSNTGEDLFSGQEDSFASLCSKISCPAEVDPLWRWSFHKKRTSTSSQPPNVEKVEEIRACKILLVRFSNMLAKKSSSRLISLEDLEKYFVSGDELCTL